MIRDFWTTNLNPVTMTSRENEHNAKRIEIKKKSSTYVTADLADDPDYIEKNKAMELLGIGAKKIKQGILDNGLEFSSYLSKGKSYYKFCDVKDITVTIPSKMQVPDDYISSKELRAVLGLTTMQLWTLAHKNGWKKKKFTGNVSYFLKNQVLINQ